MDTNLYALRKRQGAREASVVAFTANHALLIESLEQLLLAADDEATVLDVDVHVIFRQPRKFEDGADVLLCRLEDIDFRREPSSYLAFSLARALSTSARAKHGIVKETRKKACSNTPTWLLLRDAESVRLEYMLRGMFRKNNGHSDA